MSYEKTTWVNGDIITAEKMNNIEDGIANAGNMLICNTVYHSNLGLTGLDKKVSEIYDALSSGVPVYVKYQYGDLTRDYVSSVYIAPIVRVYNYNYTNNIRICAMKSDYIGDKNSKTYLFSPSTIIYSATSLDAYPTYYASVYPPNNYVTVNTNNLD